MKINNAINKDLIEMVKEKLTYTNLMLNTKDHKEIKNKIKSLIKTKGIKN